MNPETKPNDGPRKRVAKHKKAILPAIEAETPALTTITRAAREICCSPISVRRMIRDGRLPAIRFSSTLVRLRREDIQKLIEESKA